MSATILPTFKGYTVDIRLREFRKIEYGTEPEFIPFSSPEGQKLLSELRAFAYEILRDNLKDYLANDKIDLFYLFDSLDNYLKPIERDLEHIGIRVADLALGLKAARKLSEKIQKELGSKEDAEM